MTRSNVIAPLQDVEESQVRSRLARFPFRCDADAQVLGVRRRGELGAVVALDTKDRKGLLERVRAGEHAELEVDAVTYIQRETPNRNHVRFRGASLRTIAKSGVGSVFLRDHDQLSVEARGGTVTASKAIKNQETGDWEFHQTFHLVKPWAVEGVLDGTIDRFSIGWHPTGDIFFRHNDEPVLDEYGWPKYWPGDELDDGTVVEWVFTDADLVETSAVNVPAVVGTGLSDLRAALSAHLGGTPPAHQPQQETPAMKKLLKALGLSADAAEESAVAAVEKLEQNHASAIKRAEAAELELKVERESHDKVKASLAKHETEAATRAAADLDAKIAALYADGRLVRVGGQEPDPQEADLRDVHAKLGAERFGKIVSRMSGKVPTQRQAGGADPNPRQGSNGFVFTPQLKKFIADMGMSEEQYLANLAKGGF